jgi:hypothetical protein
MLTSKSDPFCDLEISKVISNSDDFEDINDEDEDDEDQDLPPELHQDIVIEEGDEELIRGQLKRSRSKSASSPSLCILTNTTLTVLRFFGQYIQMADTLRPVACEVIRALFSVYDLYLYSVYFFFAGTDEGGSE